MDSEAATVTPGPGVAASRDGRIGRLKLDRQKALNALDLPMIRFMRQTLDLWREDHAVEAVVVEGVGRAFCAGGDIRAVRVQVLAADYEQAERFFAEEYALNGAIARYPKPYISLINGICMGGGLGVSVHGTHRVVTEAAVMAMPETAIGLAPDIGASFFLPRLPGFPRHLSRPFGPATGRRRYRACRARHGLRAGSPATGIVCGTCAGGAWGYRALYRAAASAKPSA